jgi:hypothetical protein
VNLMLVLPCHICAPVWWHSVVIWVYHCQMQGWLLRNDASVADQEHEEVVPAAETVCAANCNHLENRWKQVWQSYLNWSLVGIARAPATGTDIKSNVGPTREFSGKTRRNTQPTNSQVTCQVPCLWSFIHSQTYHIRLSTRKNNSDSQLQSARLNRLPESAPVDASGIGTSSQPEDGIAIEIIYLDFLWLDNLCEGSWELIPSTQLPFHTLYIAHCTLCFVLCTLYNV